MKQHIRLLDCTLRDGGHINQGQFGKIVIRNTIERLVEAGIDIVEVGFLWDKAYGTDTARYHTIADVKRILPKITGKTKFSLMADFIDLNHLEPYDGTIEYIRLAFKRWRLDWGLKTAQVLMDKGYKVFINPVNNNVYSDKEYIEVLEKVNELHPYGFSIVDTFGTMRINDLSHRYYLVENNLLPDITIGLHLHENLGLAYSLAQHFTQIASPTRNILIDGSLLGMGRVPGNVCIEQVAEYLNYKYGTEYQSEPIYDAIDDYIAPIKEREPWGYAFPYAMSAKYNLHRTYAEYLAAKNRLKTKDIQRILRQIPQSEAETYNEEYIKKLYLDYMNVRYDEKSDMQALENAMQEYSKILIIAPGSSLKISEQEIKDIIDDQTCVISVNFNPDFIKTNYIFLTNTKRFDALKDRAVDNKLIITSNLLRDINSQDYTVYYNDLVYFNEEYCDDSTMMLLNLLKKLHKTEVIFAGFDGRVNGQIGFYDSTFVRKDTKQSKREQIRALLSCSFPDCKFTFLTKSEYDN